MYNFTVETIEMNYIKISSEDGTARFYDLNNWTIGAAVENYIAEELIE